MHPNSTSKLLDLKDCFVKKVIHGDTTVTIFVSTKSKPCPCPNCGSATSRVHDYRNQRINDIPIMHKRTTIVLRKRRYICSCGKRFYEPYTFLPRYHRMTSRLVSFVCNELRSCVSVAHVAEKANISSMTVCRIFDHIQYPKPRMLPPILAIDEFKGNASGEKYQCILVDPKKKTILDILPDRKQEHLIGYLKSYSRHERLKVRFFVCDMWKQYADIAKLYFPNATIIIDKYHFVRQITWAVENVRKRVQKAMIPELRRYFKRSRTLILKRNAKLTSDEKEKLEAMLLYSEELRQAYWLKESFYDICQNKKYSVQRKDFLEWITYAENRHLKEFQSCVTAFKNWRKEILNAFKYGYTNGTTEGFNNKIKVLKRISYGIRNFSRLRNRILHLK